MFIDPTLISNLAGFRFVSATRIMVYRKIAQSQVMEDHGPNECIPSSITSHTGLGH